MPMKETPDELAESIADMSGVYGAAPVGGHDDDCACRLCFTVGMARRIRESVTNEEDRPDEPLFSCSGAVARMTQIHWRGLGEDAIALRAVMEAGSGTLGEVLRKARQESRGVPVYRLLQALATLAASGLVDTAG